MKNPIYYTLNKLRPISTFGFVTLISIFALQACGDSSTNPPPENLNIVQVAEGEDNFSTLVQALQDAGLTATLEGDGPFTVFAPTNQAFDNLPNGLLSGLSNQQLAEILSYHVVPSEIASSSLGAEQSAASVEGGELFVTVNNSTVSVNDNATVIDPDIFTSNGVIHAIDQVVLPDPYLDIVGVVSKRYRLQALEDAVVSAGLASTLQGNGPFTVFAPTNQAFANTDLSGYNVQDVLEYHVLADEVLSSEISSGNVTTVNGAELTITVNNDGSVDLTDQAGNTYSVTTVDLQGVNGVVHIIDGVLLPS